MKRILPIVLFVVFLALLFFSWQWYKNTVVCCEVAPVESTEVVKVNRPLTFNCSTDSVIVTDLWEQKQQEIVSGSSESAILFLNVPYFESESEELAWNRSENIIALFPEIDPSNIIVEIYALEDCEQSKEMELHGLTYMWKVDESKAVSELESTVVYYEYNSENEVQAGEVQAYFEKLAVFLVETNDEIMITGNTDDVGSEQYNYNLGLRRAVSFEGKLVKLGVDKERVSVQSAGELSPLVENNSNENRQINRRVEIKITE